MKVLFVCTSNTCRSAMAQVIFSNICKRNGRRDIVVCGAGTHAYAGEPMTLEARTALAKCGEKLGKRAHRSSLFTGNMLHEFDYIIAMTSDHARYIGSANNVYSLDDFASCGDVYDPYSFTVDVYAKTCKQLQCALEILYNKIARKS